MQETRQEWATVAGLLIVVLAAASAFALNEYDRIDRLQTEAIEVFIAHDIPFDQNTDTVTLTTDQNRIVNHYNDRYVKIVENGKNYFEGFLWGSPFFLFLLYGIVLIILGDFSNKRISFGQLPIHAPTVKDSFLLALFGILVGMLGYTVSSYGIFIPFAKEIILGTITIWVGVSILVKMSDRLTDTMPKIKR